MIIRIWKGTTSHQNADKYENLLQTIVFPKIKEKKVNGYHGIQLLRKDKSEITEYITIMAFENLNSIKEFAGENYETAYVIEEAKALLNEYDLKATHYEVLHDSIS